MANVSVRTWIVTVHATATKFSPPHPLFPHQKFFKTSQGNFNLPVKIKHLWSLERYTQSLHVSCD